MAGTESRVDDVLLCVAKIVTFSGGKSLTNATGFFFLKNDYLYLITARHVVANYETGHTPDSIQVLLHNDNRNLQCHSGLSIPLYLDGISQWWEHPTLGNDVDLVAISVNIPTVLLDHLVATFTPHDIASVEDCLPLGQDVFIVGFPLGFHDTLNHLPIVRHATVASSFQHPFKGSPYFLTDAQLHRGMSGAPVIARLTRRDRSERKVGPTWKLLGIHSSAVDVSDRDSDQDEKLALNMTWYATLLSDMLPADQTATVLEAENFVRSAPVLMNDPPLMHDRLRPANMR